MTIYLCKKSVKFFDKTKRNKLEYTANEEITCKLIKIKLEGFWSHFILPFHRITTV